MTIQNSKLTLSRTRGVTLVELLIVITILSVITAIMIPQLRLINKDRSIREAARVVAGAFNKASTRAINEGTGGLIIVPNANFRNEGAGHGSPATDVFYAGTRIYQTRRLPPYIGDDVDATATITAGGGATAVAQIDRPFEHDPSAGREIIQPFDSISFNGSAFRYDISNVMISGGSLNITFVLGSAPAPNSGTAGIPFVIHRQPRRIESSLVELPEGFMIDLRYSGAPIADPMQDEYGTYLSQDGLENYQQNVDASYNGEVVVQFDSTGAVDRMFYFDLLRAPSSMPNGRIIAEIPQSQLFWFVSAYDPDVVVDSGTTVTPLDSPSSMWVTVNHLTGSVNVASSAQPTHSVDLDGSGDVTLADAIIESRAIANEQQSAAQ